MTLKTQSHVFMGVAYALCMGVCGNVLVGIGSLLEDLADNVGTSATSLGSAFLVRGLGQLMATPVAATLYRGSSANQWLCVFLFGIMSLWISLSYIETAGVLYLWFFATGICTASLDTGTQMLTRRAFGLDAGPWLTTNTLFFASAGAISPIVMYIFDSLQYQTFFYAALALLAFSFVAFHEIRDRREGNQQSIVTVSGSEVDNDNLGSLNSRMTHALHDFCSPAHKTEHLLGMLIFLGLGSQNFITMYLITFVDETNVADEDTYGPVMETTYWVTMLLSRLIAISFQHRLQATDLFKYIMRLLHGCLFGILFFIPAACTGVQAAWEVWIALIIHGICFGPLLGYVFDLQNKLSFGDEDNSWILIFYMNMGTTLLPALWALTWDASGSYAILPVGLVVSALPMFVLIRMVAQMAMRERVARLNGVVEPWPIWDSVLALRLKDVAMVLYFLTVTGFFLIAASNPQMYGTQFGGDCTETWSFCTDVNEGQMKPVIYFYSFLYALGIWGLARSYSTRFRRATERMLSIRGVYLNICISECVLLTTVCLLMYLWLTFWLGEVGYPDTTERVNKTIGHALDLVLSLTMLLTARTTFWDYIVGMSYEQYNAFHRALGILALILLVLHFVMWQVKFLADGEWVERAVLYEDDRNVNLVTGEDCTSWETFRATCGNGHFWAIPCMEVWFLLLGAPALFIALPPVRSAWASHKIFKLLHWQFVILFPLAFYHSWNLWRYACVGIFFWAVSWTVSQRRSLFAVTMLQCEEVGDGIVRLQLQHKHPDASLTTHRPGQFGYLNIPAMDQWEWHPFTISSAPCSSPLSSWTHHIKRRSPGACHRKCARGSGDGMHLSGRPLAGMGAHTGGWGQRQMDN
ncbi:hypothetical protein CYMTET_20764 [Cymbomonas tetramitiformis]|uniref:FAD-binding FR-type domain-containing protein n=1 Tax=Cymbomonas tetramitiformis TaxID=36881 RepID=A0AAE0L3J6_9CHLO|nr:hypothetical protein CYMTET_20764 [Cymbomonas tetramitiformis]